MTRFYKVVFLFLIISIPCTAQVDTEFWFAPPEITSGHGDSPLVLRISTQSEAATVHVSLPANNNLELANVTIPANTTHVLDLSNWVSLLETFPVPFVHQIQSIFIMNIRSIFCSILNWLE